MCARTDCPRRYYKAAKLAEALVREEHYTVDEKQKSVLMTEDGYEAAEDVLEVESIAQTFGVLHHCDCPSPAPSLLRNQFLRFHLNKLASWLQLSKHQHSATRPLSNEP